MNIRYYHLVYILCGQALECFQNSGKRYENLYVNTNISVSYILILVKILEYNQYVGKDTHIFSIGEKRGKENPLWTKKRAQT